MHVGKAEKEGEDVGLPQTKWSVKREQFVTRKLFSGERLQYFPLDRNMCQQQGV